METLAIFLARACAVILILTLHEFAHAFVAYKCGDSTAKLAGRLTLNPLKHFDPAGLLMFVLVGFGWAKPVPINPYNFKHEKSGLFFTAAAGITLNLLLAFLFFPVYYIIGVNFPSINYLFFFINSFLNYFVVFNLNFFVFNLIPLYPLDGFRIWDALDRKRGKFFCFIRQYGYYILLGLVIESYLCTLLSGVVPFVEYFDILGTYMGYVINGLLWLIKSFWGLFF